MVTGYQPVAHPPT